MLGAGQPEYQVPLFAADCVVALNVREGAPISKPLIGGPTGPRGSASRGRRHSGGQWTVYRIRGSGLDPLVYKWGN